MEVDWVEKGREVLFESFDPPPAGGNMVLLALEPGSAFLLFQFL